jgi:hypothetical protein
MKSSKERSQLLREAIKNKFFTFLKDRGFIPQKHSSLSYNFYRIKDQKIHLLDIQWDKYNRPRFIVNFSELEWQFNEEGKQGIKSIWTQEFIPIEEAKTYKGYSLRLYPSKNPLVWFSYGLWDSLFSSHYENKVVEKLLKYFEEIENWYQNHPDNWFEKIFRDGHISYFPLPKPKYLSSDKN